MHATVKDSDQFTAKVIVEKINEYVYGTHIKADFKTTEKSDETRDDDEEEDESDLTAVLSINPNLPSIKPTQHIFIDLTAKKPIPVPVKQNGQAKPKKYKLPKD